MTLSYDVEMLRLALGAITAPLALVAWSAFAAWFMWDESEGYDI